MAEVTSTIRDHGLNIVSTMLGRVKTDEPGWHRLVLRLQTEDLVSIIEELENRGFSVTSDAI